ncbi:MAG: FGGY-family carbohydrate kinase [Candidatus Helarchaeota archaeon]
MSNNPILIFDVGTTGARSIIFDVNGNEIARSYVEYPKEKQPPGVSEQDPQMWWEAIKTTCKDVVKIARIVPKDLVGISACFFRATTAAIDKEGNVLYPAITWMDERKSESAEKLYDSIGELRRAINKILWIKDNKPDIFEKTHKFIQPDSYIYKKLAGVFATDYSNAAYGVLDYDSLKLSDELTEKFGIPMDRWVDVHESGKVIGELTSDAANELGLTKGIPIVMGGADQQSAALGLGTMIGEIKATTGTGTFVDAVTEKPVYDQSQNLFTLPHVVKGQWVLEGAMPGTGAALNWFRDNFSEKQCIDAEAKKVSAFKILEEEAENVPAGSGGLLIIPLYSFMKATVHGLGFGHSRGFWVRSIMESAALSIRLYLGFIEPMTNKVKSLKIDGGSARSDLWTQIQADVTGKTVLIPKVIDGAAMGAAILGYLGTGNFGTIGDAVKNMVKFIGKKEPNPANKKIYKKLFRVFETETITIHQKKRITGKIRI